MKSALFAVVLGAFVAVRAADNDGPGDEDSARALFEEASQIDWSRFSPGALGMRLNFDELSDEELDKVVAGFIQLGLIEESERESFKESLTHPSMRNMIATVQDNWGSTMTKILKDPAFGAFLQKLKGGVDDAALGQIVGFDGGIGEAVKRLQEEQDDLQGEVDVEEDDEEEEEQEQEEQQQQKQQQQQMPQQQQPSK